MNYRHAFHAGNFADCMKHALLIWLMQAMARKPAGFTVLDTHAGLGRYDLNAGPATRTGEWLAGIARLLDAPPPELADYVGLVQRLGLYPGSPAIIEALLRPQDRLVACELHPEDYAVLRANLAGNLQVAVHHRDGWEALTAFLPPRDTTRALVLIDPPYEVPDEFDQLGVALQRAVRRFAVGVFAAWYPVKHRAGPRGLHLALRQAGLKRVAAVELWLRDPTDPARLTGCGLLLINPPFGFLDAARTILAALLDRLGQNEPGAGFWVEELAGE